VVTINLFIATIWNIDYIFSAKRFQILADHDE